MNNHALENRNMGDNILGEEEHQVAAREALPILIELAKAEEKINYSTLADQLGIFSYGEPMSKMLDSIVTTLYELGEEWGEKLPRLTALIVKRDTGYPGFPPGIPNEEFDAEFERIYNYPKWDTVQQTLLPVPESDAQKGIAEELRGIREELQSIKRVLINLGDRFDRP